ncbi:MAG TPA: 1-acyl-sn-glycerol-3-phosphate acyltransferase [Polyangiaceae bacterium]
MANELSKNLATALARLRGVDDGTRPLVTYEPNPLLKWAFHRFFEHIQVDEAWTGSVRRAEARGTVVYVLRSLSPVDFFALDYLTKQHKLPQVHFANDLGLWLLEPMGRGWLNALARDEATDAEDLRLAVSSGASVALFLKRPPTLLDGGQRGRIEGDKFLRTLLDVQRKQQRPILLVPQVFVWSKHGDEAQHNAIDAVLGPREWPGKIRAVAQFLGNYRSVTLRAGEPLDIKTFMESERAKNGGADDGALVRRMTYVLLRRLERERRAVVGPTRKPADRLREEVLRSPRLQKIITDMAGEGANERRILTLKAHAMLREMEAQPDANVLSVLDQVFDQTVGRMYTELEVDTEGIERLRKVAKEGTIVLLPSHKSHIDYIVLTYVLYHHHLQTPLIAAGDNLNFAPMGPILRRAGAFFIRRSFKGDRLYQAVVDAYMRKLLRDGWPLEFFLEGGRSRTGKLLPPKLGLLNIIVDAALGLTETKTFFVPISIGYERLVEEQAFVSEVSGGEKSKEDVRGLIGTTKLLGQRYGRLSVQFGEIQEIDKSEKLTPARRRALVTRLAYRVMNEINRVTAVTPGSLVAAALLTHGKRGTSYDDLVTACERLANVLHGFGARFSPSLSHPQIAEDGRFRIRLEAIREACDLFVRAGNVEARLPGDAGKKTGKLKGALPGAIFVVPDESRLSLDLAKNLLVHFFVTRGLVATALASAGKKAMAVDALRERVQTLSRLFKYEFTFRADATFERIFDETLAAMASAGELSIDGPMVMQPDSDNVRLYVEMLRNFVEGYRVAARALSVLVRGPLAPKDIVKKAITIGERMFLAGDIQRREAVSGPLIENALSAFVDLEYVNRSDGKLELPESYASTETVRTIEAKVAGFVAPT